VSVIDRSSAAGSLHRGAFANRSLRHVKAAVYYTTGNPDVLRYEDVPDPTCGPGDVLVRVEAISIEGGDTLNRAGGEMPAVPHVVGYQCAGTVVEVGADVADRSIGQRVVATMLWGSHAELVAVPAMLTWIQAGAGGVGLAAIQLADRAGATVLATASSDDRLDKLREFGLDHGINYSNADWVGAVRAATNGRGVDLVVDSVGGAVLDGSVQCLAYRGRAITVGNAGRDPRPFDISVLAMGNQSLTGVFLGAEITTPRAQAMIARLIDDVAAGRLRVVVDRTYPLAEAAAAHAYLESRRAVGRVVLVP
jgi:NADPH2:quinone reductase